MIREKKDLARLEHILDAVRKALASIDGLTLEQFLENPDKRAAAERYVTIVGEAANMVSDELKAKYPQVPWREAADMRNFKVFRIKRWFFVQRGHEGD